MNAQEFLNTDVARLYADISPQKMTTFLTSNQNRVASIVEDSEKGEDREIKLALLAKRLGSKTAAVRIGEILHDSEQTWYVLSNERSGTDKQYHTVFEVGLAIETGSNLTLPIFSSYEYAQNYHKVMQVKESLDPDLKIPKYRLYNLFDVVGRKTNLSINPLNEPFYVLVHGSYSEQIAIGLGVRDVQAEWLAGEGAAIEHFKSQERVKPLLDMDEDVLIEEMRSALTMAAMGMGNYLDYFRIAAVAYQRCPEKARSDYGYWIIGQRASQNKRALKWAQDNLNNQPEDPLAHVCLALALLQIDPIGMEQAALDHIKAALKVEPKNFEAIVILHGIAKMPLPRH